MLTTKGPSAMSIDHHPAQAPRNKTTHPQAHPERVRTNFGDTPAYPGYEPDHLDTVNPDQLNRRSRKVILGAGVMSALIGAGVFLGSTINDAPKEGPVAGSVEADTNSGIDNQENTGSISGAEDGLEINTYDRNAVDALSYVGFSTLENEVRVQRYAAELDAKKDKALEIMRQAMTPEQNALITNDFPKNKAAYSDQEILNRYAIDTYDASIQGAGEDGQKEGRKMQSVIMSPDNPNFSAMIEKITGDNGLISVLKATGPDYSRLRNTTLRGHEIGENGAEVIYARNTYTGQEGYSLFTLVEAPNGDTIWQHTDQFATTDMSIQYDIAQAVENSHS